MGEILAEQFPGVDLGPVFEILTIKAELALAPGLFEPMCDDPEDEKFLACTLSTKTKPIVSEDKHLLKASCYRGVDIMKPRQFVDNYLR